MVIVRGQGDGPIQRDSVGRHLLAGQGPDYIGLSQSRAGHKKCKTSQKRQRQTMSVARGTWGLGSSKNAHSARSYSYFLPTTTWLPRASRLDHVQLRAQALPAREDQNVFGVNEIKSAGDRKSVV